MPVPVEITLEFARASNAGDPFAVAMEAQDYLLRAQGGTYRAVSLDWRAGILDDLAAVQRPGADPILAQRLGERLRALVEPAGWERHEREIAAVIEAGGEVRLTLRSAAAELYALPWELLALRDSGRMLGELPGVLLRYEWPGSETAPESPSPRAEGGRVLLAWSGAGGRVPHREHLTAIEKAAKLGFLDFDPGRDQVADATIERLAAALEPADGQAPVAVLHLLCHGARRGGSFGLAFDSDTPGKANLVDPGRLRQVLGPYAPHLRLVLISACMGGNMGDPGNHLGSAAQTLHRAGIERVIASRYPLSIAGSNRLTETFYEALLVEPMSVESAFLLARRRLALESANLDWASLQLYARESDAGDGRPIVFRPYRGLLAFEPSHNRFFFGRDLERRQILDGLTALERDGLPRFQVVAGASGTGKSSVVMAGALPELLGEPGETRDGDPERVKALLQQVRATFGGLGEPEVKRALETLATAAGRLGGGAARWELARMRPGADPLDALKDALRTRTDPSARLLLLVDQFEELFTLAPQDQRHEFAQKLWLLSRAPDSGVTVMITIRVDFLGHCGEVLLDEGGLRLDRVAYDERHKVFIAQLGFEQMREAIEHPAARVGLALEAGLSGRMLAEVEGEPGALPLVSYTLDLLWQRRKGHLLTVADYEALGGVVGALQQRADGIVTGFDADHQAQVRRLMVNLVAIRDDGGFDSRRRVTLDEIRPADGKKAAAFDAAVAALVAARLLVQSEEEGQRTVEVAHEALIRKWERLREWVMEDRDKLVEIRELRGWIEQCVAYRTTLQGEQLLKATGIAARHPDDIDAATGEIIRRSQAAVQRRQRVVAALQIAGFVVALLMAGLGWWGWSNGQIAQAKALEASRNAEEARINETRAKNKEKLALENENRAKEQEQLALQNQQEAIANAVRADEEAKKALEALSDTELARASESVQRQAATEAASRATTARGRALDTLRLLGAQQLAADPWRALPFLRAVETPSELPGYLAMAWHLLQSPASALARSSGGALVNDRAVAFDPVFNQLVTVVDPRAPRVRLLRIDDGSAVDLALPGAPLRPTAVAFRKDGLALWMGDESGAVYVWDLRAQTAPREIPASPAGSPITALRFSEDGARAAVASMAGGVRVLDALDPSRAPRPLPHVQPVWEALFSPAGDALVTTSADGRVRRWSLAPACAGVESPACLASIDVCVDTVPCSAITAAWATDGATLLVAGAPQKVMRWDFASAPVPLPFVGQATRDTPANLRARPGSGGLAVRTLRGGVVVIGGRSGAVELPVALPARLAHVVTDLGWSDDGRLLITSALDGPPRLWAIGEDGSLENSWPLQGHGDVETVFVALDRQNRALTVDRAGGVRAWVAQAPDPVSRVLSGVTGKELRRLGFDGDQLLVETTTACVRFNSSGDRLAQQPGTCAGSLQSAAEQRVGEAVVLGLEDGTVQLQVPNGTATETLVMRGHLGAVKRVALRGDLRAVASAGADGPVRLWPLLDVSELSSRLVASARGCVEARDRTEYLGSLAADVGTAPVPCGSEGR